MTMTRSDKLKNGEQEKGFRNFHGNFDLNVTAPEMEEQPHVQCQLIENHNSQFSELPGRMKNQKDNDSVDAQQRGEHVHQTKTVDGCIDHLLILAQSAEIVAQSEGVAGMNTNQDKDLHNNLVGQMSRGYSSNITSDDQEYSRELLHSSSVDSPVSIQGCGFRNEVTRPCLTQILKQAGCEYLIMDQEKRGDNQCKNLHGKTIRLSQIKHQARCKSKKDLSPQKMINGPRNEQPQGRILRLSQIKHQARSKGNATAKEGTEEHIGGSLHCNIFKDNNKEKVVASRLGEEGICRGDSSLSMVEGAPAHNISWGASQSSVGYLAPKIVRRLQSRSHQFAAVKRDDENIRESQRTARRLRAFKIKKQRQESRTDCIGSSASMGLHDMKMGHIGLTSINNSPWLSHNATSLKDKNLIACQQELPKASSCNEKLRASFGVEKLQGHLGSIESLGVRCNSVTHIPNGLPAQNSGLPYNIFLQYDNYMGWMSYMHHMQLKENYRVVARQRRAVRIQEKRVLKDKQQNSENPVQASNSEAQKEFMPVKRLRLTQLRREVRLGNQQHSVIHGPAEN